MSKSDRRTPKKRTPKKVTNGSTTSSPREKKKRTKKTTKNSANKKVAKKKAAKKAANAISRDRRGRRVSGKSPLAELEEFLSQYLVLDPLLVFVMAIWIMAAWLADLWDRFPHLAITSPERRCGKTRALQLIALVTPNAHSSMNISPAAIYRLIQQVLLTLILDEAQSLERRGSEAAEVTREIFNAAIDRNAKVLRVAGPEHEVQEFSIYCPKAFALIGEPDGVVADRCLPIRMRRKTPSDTTQPYRSRKVEPIGKEIHDKLEAWAEANKDHVAKIYDESEELPIENDRMAELLLSLLAVAKIVAPDRLAELGEFAEMLDRETADNVSDGTILLNALREIFRRDKNQREFLPTSTIIQRLVRRTEEPWARYSHGRQITAASLAVLLRPYDIRSTRDTKQSHRGFYKYQFEEAWSRYLPPLPGTSEEPA